MTVMSVQPPLPLAPAGAAWLNETTAMVVDEDGGRVYHLGVLVSAWSAGDEVGRRLAAAQLVELGLAKTRPVAAAFEVTDHTVWRWRKDYEDRGVAGLIQTKRGPKGPSKLTAQVVAEIRSRKQQGVSNRAVARGLGISEASVRYVLAADQQVRSRAEQSAPGQEGPAGGVGIEDSEPAAEQQAAEQVDDLPDDLELQEQQEEVAAGQVEMLADPLARPAERGLARWGLLGEATAVFTAAGRVPLAGMLLALPGLAATGLLECARDVYGGLPAGFYGLDTVLLEAVFRTLAGRPRAEGAARCDPVVLGRVLGMDRAPEVKTIRRKLAQLAGAGKGDELIAALARRHLEGVKGQDQEAVVLYVDGHVRAYTGTKKIAKTHLARLRFPAPATVETWVSDADGDPVIVVMAAPGASLAGELRRLLPDLRDAVGDDRRVLVGFDRGGWSPALFKHMGDRGFDVLTWRKQPADDLEADVFAEVVYRDEHGREHAWMLADTMIDLLLEDDTTLAMRQVTRLDPKNGRQAHVITTRTDLSAGEVIYRMGSRWRQENYFRYGRLHLELDSHDSYTATADDPDRSVPNPAKRAAYKKVQAAAARLERERARADAALLAARSPAPGAGQVIITNQVHNQLTAPLRVAEDDLAAARAAHGAIPARVPLGQLAPDQQVLDVNSKLITHAIKIAAFNTITAIARDIRIHTTYARADDEAYTLARQVLTHTGDIDPRTLGALTIRLDPMPTARETRAVAELCKHLNATATVYPGTDRVLRYEIKQR